MKKYLVLQSCIHNQPRIILLNNIQRIVEADNEDEAVDKFLRSTKNLFKERRKLDVEAILLENISVIK